ncbi:MAG TPA: hypothetical protein DDW86_03525, partial [Clostridiales bacterium]|nr:hypothetical protein [Clostridiales bacterium]
PGRKQKNDFSSGVETFSSYGNQIPSKTTHAAYYFIMTSSKKKGKKESISRQNACIRCCRNKKDETPPLFSLPAHSD